MTATTDDVYCPLRLKLYFAVLFDVVHKDARFFSRVEVTKHELQMISLTLHSNGGFYPSLEIFLQVSAALGVFCVYSKQLDYVLCERYTSRKTQNGLSSEELDTYELYELVVILFLR